MSADPAAAPRFARLAGGATSEVTADEALDGWRSARAARSGVALNMIASVDGRIAVDGHSGPLGSIADRALFHALRARADAVLVGAGTVRTERYGPIVKDPAVGERRRLEGLERQPLALIVSHALELDPALGLLADEDSHIVMLTSSQGDLLPPGAAARVDYVRTASLRDGLDQVRERWGARVIVGEGGPSLNGRLAAEGLIDELFLAIAPLLVGEVPGGGALVRGGAPSAPLELELRMLLAHGSHLYANYVSRS